MLYHVQTFEPIPIAKLKPLNARRSISLQWVLLLKQKQHTEFSNELFDEEIALTSLDCHCNEEFLSFASKSEQMIEISNS